MIVLLVAVVAAGGWVYNARANRASSGSGHGSAGWMTDADAAFAKARAEKLPVLMNFTGSDWCGWCIKLDKEVFSTAEFAAYAKDNLILLKLDFPRQKAQSSAEKARNEALAQKYGIRGFPTIVVAKADGAEKGRLGYEPGGPKAWLAALKREM